MRTQKIDLTWSDLFAVKYNDVEDMDYYEFLILEFFVVEN